MTILKTNTKHIQYARYNCNYNFICLCLTKYNDNAIWTFTEFQGKQFILPVFPLQNVRRRLVYSKESVSPEVFI